MRHFFDESGDLGFDFSRGASDHFSITGLVIRHDAAHKSLEKVVKTTMHRKMHIRKRTLVNELKGTNTDISVKKYLWRNIADLPFDIHAIILDKRKLNPAIQKQRDRIYNYLARLVVDDIDVQNVTGALYIQIDRSKGKHGRDEFNQELRDQIEGNIPLNVPLAIDHPLSERSRGIQMADIFGWGVFRKYEREDTEWYDIFKDKIVSEQLFTPPTEWRN